ncbi:DUF3290 domain-containing protein [Streptococcaceae bacterium ESL0729]|nr:DUF3290 domain-containing protein [Streptococcaceae bacterium ESL0729]
MVFYGINFLESQSGINYYLKYFLVFGSLILMVVVFVLYMRHRIQTKYRDLGIIFFLTLLFSLGVQYSDYQSNQLKHAQYPQMVKFVQDVSQNKKVSTSKIYVNATQLTDGVIVRIDDIYYKVSLAASQKFYSLTEVEATNTNIIIKD